MQTRESLANTLSISTHGPGHLVKIIAHKRDQSSSDGDQQKLTMRVKKENFEVIEYLINERSRKLKFWNFERKLNEVQEVLPQVWESLMLIKAEGVKTCPKLRKLQ